ncbi:hypothetical protein CP336_13860 [Pseudomonas fluorescens]|nr:hypothetical protein CP336_13860 [Pseudomonas fluorescens]
MRELCYIPKPTEFEGPRSLLMRMAHYNGFGTVRRMCAYFAVSPDRWIDVLGQHSPLLKIVDREAPLLADGLRNVFYNVAPSKAPCIKAADIHLLRGACPRTYYYCPQCIEMSQSPIFHDICDIGMCLLHGWALIAGCPSCRATEDWYDAQLFHCKCGFERRTACRMTANFTPCLLDPFGSPQVVEGVLQKHRIAKVCAALWDARRSDDNHTYCDLPLKVIEHIDMTVAAQVEKYPGFIKSLHRAPWINYGSASVAWLADRAVSRFYIDNQPCSDDCCRFATIDRNNARRAIFDNGLLFGEMSADCKIYDWMERQSSYLYTCPPRCEIIRRLNAKYSAVSELYSTNPDGVTEDEVAALLRCPLSAVNALLRQGWLKRLDATGKLQSPVHHVFDRLITEQFSKHHVLLHELCDIFDLPDYLLINLMNAAKLQGTFLSMGSIFFPRAPAFALLSQLKSRDSPCKVVEPSGSFDNFEEIQYALKKIEDFQTTHTMHIRAQKTRYFRFAK